MTKRSTKLIVASLATLLSLLAVAPLARADIFQWEYINPANPGLGKQQSTTLAPDGAGVNAVPGADLFGRDLTMAYLVGADLTGANADVVTLTDADLSWANLTNASFNPYENEYGIGYPDLTGANLSGAIVLGTQFNSPNLTMSQLASTASYQARNLAGIGLQGANFAAANFASQNLTNATFNGATLTGSNFNHASAAGIVFANVDLANASFHHANLANSYFDGAIVDNADFSGAFLVGARMGVASLTGAYFAGAEIRFADFSQTGISAAQLYSTASYHAHDLRGIKLQDNFTNANFVGQDLSNARLKGVLANADLGHTNLVNVDFGGFLYYDDVGGVHISPGAILANANLTGADLRGAKDQYATLDGANTSNLIQSNGHVAGLDLTAGATLVVRDYDGNPLVFPSTGVLPIVIEQHLAMDATGTLRLEFDADPWDSTISFAPGIPVALGGTLDLTFAPDVNIATQGGRTIDLFDWTGVTPTGTFTVSSPYTWNLTNLYTTGEVTLLGTPISPGDFDGDGDVDGRDFLAWQRNPSVGNLADWQANYGTGSLVATNVAVPEPSSLLLLMMAIAGRCVCRQMDWRVSKLIGA